MIGDLIAAYTTWATICIVVPLGFIAAWQTLKEVLKWE